MISDADAIAPTKLQALVDCYRRGELTREDYLEYLRHDYHSVHARVRTEALALLDDLPEPERTRELIWLADECQWRETRIDIVRALGVKPLPRGLEFLIHLATDDADLGMCREAIAALGRSQEPLAARYLATRYQTGPPALKPYIAYALGELLDCTLAQQFLDDLRTAQRNEQILWTESLALALAELNVDTCIDTLVDMLRVQPRSVAISALLAMGKLAQEPDVLELHFGWHLARIKCLSCLIVASFKVKTVNFVELATAFSGSAKVDSHYRRIQRFFKEIQLQQDAIA
ncbi:hypothetical protein C2W62_43225, partial [Candidatus Entotheonella serta]